ncbi:MAG: hypothetical protein FJ387_24155 [Verrucomicrobia bacterium]|nr:hypothetical protein [Verrucomicrobiota bacterium]
MRTTIDLPNSTFEQAKCLAESQGVSGEQLFTNAIEEKLRTGRGPDAMAAWMKLAGAFGKTAADRAETRRIQQAMDQEFERIEPEGRQ